MAEFRTCVDELQSGVLEVRTARVDLARELEGDDTLDRGDGATLEHDKVVLDDTADDCQRMKVREGKRLTSERNHQEG